MKAKTIRAIHRDLGYLYVGLIISFAFSGILMNHRSSWHPDKFTVESKAIQIEYPSNKSAINDAYVEQLATTLHIDDKLKHHMVRKGELRMTFENTDVTIDMKTGKGEITHFVKLPFISQTMALHKNTSNWWIYYSDIFGLSLITIALTGMFMLTHGKYTFKQRGWKLALAGILAPVLVLVLVV